ncbi:hypothetical protein [Tautonia plasticadhaerens]|nr:hypothetical protein [Tautonia plasticadhaerens]
MSDAAYQQLVEVAGTIARHLDYPGKPDAIRVCREDIRERCLRGVLSPEQGDRLTAMLSGGDRLMD